MFRLLFDRSTDAIFLFDPRREVFVDCNQAAVAMMRADDKQQILNAHPADLSPEFQPDGESSREKTPKMAAIAMATGSHGFEWIGRRFDGTEFPVEVLTIPIESGDNPLIATICRDITERKAAEAALRESENRFRLLFERSADAMSLFNPQTGRFVEVNEAVVRQTGAPNKEALGNATPAEISPERQPDGRLSSEKAQEMVNLTLARGSHRFEWMSRRYDGSEQPLDIVMTAVPFREQTLLFLVARDISEHKRAEREILRLNSSLEHRVAERTVELVQANDQLKTEIHERRRQEKIERRRSEQMQKHRDVMLKLARSDKSDLNTTIEKIIRLASETLDVARVSYWSFEDNDRSITCELLYLRDVHGVDPRSKGVRLAAADCPAYFEALATKRPVIANDVLNHPATSGLLDSYLTPLGITSMLDAPVWVRGEVVGVICHEHVGPARQWSAEEIDFASALAAMVSLAVEESNRARSEHLLRESEEKFRALFEAASQGVMLHDEKALFAVNPAALRILGYSSANDLIGKHPADISAPRQPDGEESAVAAQRHIQKCLRDGSTRFDWLTIRPDGVNVMLDVQLTRIELGGRQIIQAVVDDITERKRAEKELRESEARLRETEARFSTAFRASPILITISRMSDACFVEANDAFVQWIGLEHSEILGRTSEELGMWENPEEREQFLEELRRTGSMRDVEARLRSRRGSSHTMLLSADIIEINREEHMLVFGLDVTERKQAEAELLRTLAREKELGQLRSSFVSMVSHEFRTPLGIIQSSAEILEDYLDQLDPAERKEHLQSIRKNTRRMAGLMEEVLLIGSFEAGRMEFKPAPVDLRLFVQRLVDDVLSATDQRCPIDLAPGEMPSATLADERLLRHIFTNLLTNAVKYSEPGRPVRFEIGCDGTDIVSTIRDRGIGIPEADREWLFHAFHRGRNVGDRPGTGLGLVIVKRCIDLHGGRIKVDSKVGEGTAITVRLPRPAKPEERNH